MRTLRHRQLIPALYRSPLPRPASTSSQQVADERRPGIREANQDHGFGRRTPAVSALGSSAPCESRTFDPGTSV